MLENGYEYMFVSPLRIDSYDTPIGIFTVFLDESEVVRLRDPEEKEKFNRISYAAAKRIELIFNMQYNRMILNE